MANINVLGISASNYLEVAKNVNNNGTKETSLVLNTLNNNFYLINDDNTATIVSLGGSVSTTNFTISASASGLVLVSANNTQWRLTVSNTGVVGATTSL